MDAAEVKRALGKWLKQVKEGSEKDMDAKLKARIWETEKFDTQRPWKLAILKVLGFARGRGDDGHKMKWIMGILLFFIINLCSTGHSSIIQYFTPPQNP